MNGTTIKNLSKELLYNYSIPIPDDPLKIEYWSNKIGEQYDLMNSSQKEKDTIEKNIIEEIERITNYEECNNFKLEDLFSFHSGKLERKIGLIGLLLNKFGLNQANRHGKPYP